MRPFAIITMLISALLTGCDKTSDGGNQLVGDPLVGKWEGPDGKSREYFSDGTVLMSEEDKDFIVNGKWSRLEDGRVKREFTLLGNSTGEIFTVKAKGDDTSFTDSKGRVSNWKRAK
jgi:hypothetical protein